MEEPQPGYGRWNSWLEQRNGQARRMSKAHYLEKATAGGLLEEGDPEQGGLGTSQAAQEGELILGDAAVCCSDSWLCAQVGKAGMWVYVGVCRCM